MSDLEEHLLWMIRAVELPEPVREYKFAAPVGRKFRADFCWIDEKIIAECEGGQWITGRHQRGQGFEDDMIKYNTATLMGYRVFRFTKNLIENGTAIDTLEKAFGRGE